MDQNFLEDLKNLVQVELAKPSNPKTLAEWVSISDFGRGHAKGLRPSIDDQAQRQGKPT